MQQLLQEIESRWTTMFTALAGGDDVPPSLRLRAEGLMEAAVLTGAAGAEQLDRAMNEHYRQAYGRSLAEDFGEDWRGFHPFPQIPAMGLRAPVYPGTRD
ncbi:MAG: hypothetical protein V2I26_19615 [Halieaceae bacterium]|jgi:hypothetical protein|nr:hypothetical protein [Halieaceae bacterium]